MTHANSRIMKGTKCSMIDAIIATNAPMRFNAMYKVLSVLIRCVRLRKKAMSKMATPMAPIQSVGFMLSFLEEFCF